MHAKHIYFRWNHEARLCNFAGPDTPKPVDAPPAPEAKNDAQITIAPAAAETPKDTQAAVAGAAQERGGMQPANQQQIEEAAARNKAAREAAAVAPTSSPALAPATAPSEPVAPAVAPASATTPEASATPGSASNNVPEGYTPTYSQVTGKIDGYKTPDGNQLIPDSDGNFNFPSTAPETPAQIAEREAQEVAARKAAEGAEAAPGAATESGDPNADRVNKAVTKLQDAMKVQPPKIGDFLAALAEVFASIKAIFKPEAAKDQGPQGPGKPPETGGNAPANGAENGTNAPGSLPETVGEKQSEKRDRVRKEVQDAGSLKDFEKNKDQQKQDLEGTIQKEEDDIQSLDNVNDGREREVRTLERQIPTGDKLDAKQKKLKSQLEDQVRDLKVDIEANKQKIEHNKNDIQEHTNEQKKATEDVQEVQDMIKAAKDSVQTLTKVLEDLSENPAAKELGADTLLSGVTITVDENKLDVVITLNEDAKETLDALSAKGLDVKPIMDLVNGKPTDAPAASPTAPAAKPDENKPAAAGEKTVEQTEQDQAQVRATRGLARVAAKFGANERVIGSLMEKGDTKAIASMIIDALKTQEHPVYIAADGSLYANESALGMDWVNPDTQIVNSDFADYLMTNPEVAMRALGDYGNKAKSLNPDTRGFLYELATAYEQGARTAAKS